jgi:iron complex outermembrane receptor protein
MQGRLNGLGDVPSMAGAEKALSYEAGIKQDLFDKRARLSAAVFQYRVKDKQLTAGSGSINMNQLINAERSPARVWNWTASQPGLRLQRLARLQLQRYRDQGQEPVRAVLRQLANNAGQRLHPTNPRSVQVLQDQRQPLPRAPRTSQLHAQVQHRSGNGEFYAYTDWTYRSSYNFFLYEAPEYKAKPLTEGGVRLGYKWGDGKYEVAAFGRNITDKQVISARSTSTT